MLEEEEDTLLLEGNTFALPEEGKNLLLEYDILLEGEDEDGDEHQGGQERC